MDPYSGTVWVAYSEKDSDSALNEEKENISKNVMQCIQN